MLMVSHLDGFGVYQEAAASGVTVAYASANGEETAVTSKTWSSAGISTAAANRYIVVAAFNRVGGAVAAPTVTVGGASTTLLIGLDGDAGANTTRADLFITDSAFTTGTTADIVISYSGTARHGYIAWAVYGISSITPADTATSSADPCSAAIDCPAGGVIIGVGFSGTDGTTSTPTELTENVDGQIGGTSTYTGLSKEYAAAQTALTVGCDFAATTSQAFAAASLSPA